MKKKKSRKPKPKDELIIEELLLQKLLRMDAELKNAVLTDQLARAEHRIKEYQWSEQAKKLVEATQQANRNFSEVVSEVEARYDIDMKEYAYDSDTGLLTPLNS